MALYKTVQPTEVVYQAFYALVKHFKHNVDYFTPKGHFLHPRAIILRTGAGRGHFRKL